MKREFGSPTNKADYTEYKHYTQIIRHNVLYTGSIYGRSNKRKTFRDNFWKKSW